MAKKNLNEICNDILNEVEEAFGCSVVDVNTGLLLAVAHNMPDLKDSYLEALAAASVDMFRGRTVTAVEKLLGSLRKTKIENSIKEIQITTEDTYNFMTIIPEKPNCLVVLVTSRKSSLGMGWSAMRRAIPEIAPLCP